MKSRSADVALKPVKAALAAGLGGGVGYTHLEGEGTLIQVVGQAVDVQLSEQLVKEGMAKA